ncbi:MAG: PEP-CTERM sorting domain-containing protein [Oceanipulchritudo sp.]
MKTRKIILAAAAVLATASIASAAILSQSYSFETGGVYDSGKLFNSNVAEWYDPAPAGSNEVSQSETDTDMPLTSAGTDWVNIKQTGLIYQDIGTYEAGFNPANISMAADFGDKSNRSWVTNGLTFSLYSSASSVTGADDTAFSSLTTTLLDSVNINPFAVSNDGTLRTVEDFTIGLDWSTVTTATLGDKIWVTIESSSPGTAGNVSQMLVDDVNITVVPEPSTYALFAGLLALGCIVYRRRVR